MTSEVSVPRSGHWKYWGIKPVPICLPYKTDPSIPDVGQWLQDIGCCCTYCMKVRMDREGFDVAFL